jgi:hypothetical protein
MKLITFIGFLFIVLIVAIFKKIFSSTNIKNIPIIIEKIAKSPSLIDTDFKKVQYAQVLKYAKDTGVIIDTKPDCFEFIVSINKVPYKVFITRSADGTNTAIFNSERYNNSIDTPKSLVNNKLHENNIVHLPENKSQELKDLDEVSSKLNDAYESHKKICSW